MSDDIIPGWAACSVGDLFLSFSGGTPDRSNKAYWKGSIPWLSSGDIKADRIATSSETITRAGLANSAAKLCRAGSVVVVVRSGILKHTLPVAILECDAAINQDIKCFDSGDNDLNRWLALALKASARDILARNREGTTVQSVKYETLKEYALAVPPPAEQKRIEDRLNKLLKKVSGCYENVSLIPNTLKRFRQSVLDAACSGRLTVDRRSDRRKRGEVENWTTVVLEELLQPGGIFDGPFGSNLKTSDYTSSGVRVVRLENIGKLYFVKEKQTYISQKKYASLKRHTVREGDVLFSSFIDEEVRVCVLPRLETASIAKADCFCIRTQEDRVDREYLAYQLASRESYNDLLDSVHGATRPRINTTQLRKLKIKICSLEEQREIVRRVKALYSIVDRAAVHHQQAQASLDDLPRAILARAFRGELVLTEAELARREGREYEPASELLQRISADKAHAPIGKPAARQTRGIRKPEHPKRKRLTRSKRASE